MTYQVKIDEREVQYKAIRETAVQYVDRPVYRNVCLDSDGLRVINAALTRTDPAKPN